MIQPIRVRLRALAKEMRLVAVVMAQTGDENAVYHAEELVGGAGMVESWADEIDL